MKMELFTCDHCKATMGSRDKVYHVELIDRSIDRMMTYPVEQKFDFDTTECMFRYLQTLEQKNRP